ncbi:hypothetical protein NE237_024769 [Protea cynaroides]|uniref:Uncharacterized protein n=1 Tax=Protea cynaroides TaxID=273540 RepID=A0A9Q0H158_9MAGN|nr:hypothetical protein NE237_024769 [Protea cynaroides]
MDDQMHDLFTEIERECYISPDQEELLRRSEFCKSRFLSVNPECSSGDTEDPEDPEDPYGNESINRKFCGETGVDPVKARGNVSPDHIRTVDLDKDNVPGFSLEKSPADKGLVPAKVVLGFSGDSSSVKQRISGEFLDGTRAPACGAHLDNVAERSGDSALRKNFGLLIAEENVNLQSGGLGGDIPVGTESVDTGFKETATKGVSPLKATDKEPESSVRRGKEVRSSLEGGSSKKRSEPPALIGGPVQNAAKRLVPDSSSENQSLDPLMDAIIELSGVENATADPPENVDILETLKTARHDIPSASMVAP